MPETKPERILSYSTEDKAFPASNLLKVNAFYKWKCEEAGAKQAFVTFKFDQPYQFNRLDIGNEGSAFVEVQVSRSTTDDTFEVLLPSSSFMSPLDAKQGSGLNRVRIFGGDELTKSIAAQKWDVVKVVCTQPFNKTIQYGLSFIRFYHVAAEEEAPAEGGGEKARGAWFFKGLGGKVGEPSTSTAAGETASNTDVLQPGGLFKMARQSSSEPPTATLAQKLLEEKRTVTPPTSPVVAASPPPPPPHQPRAPTSLSVTNSAKPKGSAATSDGAPAVGSSGSSAEPSSSTSANRRPILSGVVVAFSGYQNPFRSELRTLCLRLGAKYCQDWTDQCTHLICAFPNTPKFNSVRGKGIIVSHKWIQACNTAKKKVSWRPYRVGRAPSPVGHVSDDNEDEEDSFSEGSMIAGDEEDDWKPGNSDVGEDDDESESMDSDASAEAEEDEDADDADDDDDDTGSARRQKATSSTKKAPSRRKRRAAGSPNHIRKRPAKTSAAATAGGDDGEKDWEPVRRKKAAGGLGSTPPANGGPTQTRPTRADEDEDTDEEIHRRLGGQDSPSSTPLPDLPDFFADKSFFIFSKDMPEKEESILRRLIIAFAGKVENYMTSAVNFVVSRASWCSDFDDALSASPTVVFVKPDWIYACDKTAKYVPYQRFQIVD